VEWSIPRYREYGGAHRTQWEPVQRAHQRCNPGRYATALLLPLEYAILWHYYLSGVAAEPTLYSFEDGAISFS